MASKNWKARVVTLFPEMFPGPLGGSLAGRALEEGHWSLDVINIRDHGTGKHRDVDDTPFGGGPGMVIRPDVISAAVDQAVLGLPEETPRLYFSPRGKRLDQKLVHDLATAPAVVMVCGRYEGIDQRAIDYCNLMEVSIGDVVLSGGELPALITIDAVVRLLPGVMGNAEAHVQDSFEGGLLEYPLYTQPREWQGIAVPEVLISGNHKAIRDWQQQQSETVTRDRRPDLWQDYQTRRNKKS